MKEEPYDGKFNATFGVSPGHAVAGNRAVPVEVPTQLLSAALSGNRETVACTFAGVLGMMKNPLRRRSVECMAFPYPGIIGMQRQLRRADDHPLRRVQ